MSMFYLKDVERAETTYGTQTLSANELMAMKIGTVKEFTLELKEGVKEKRKCEVVWTTECHQGLNEKCQYVSCCVCKALAKRIGEIVWEKLYGEDFKEFKEAGFPPPIQQPKKLALKF